MKVLIGLAILILISCTNTHNQGSDLDEILQLLELQQEAWNQGDKESFMQAYWKSDSLLFYGASGPTYGWEETLQNYHKRYPDQAAMGTLTFGVDHLKRIESSSCLMMGTYDLKRETEDLNGFFSLIWKKVGGEWKIIADMTCSL